MAEKSAVEKLLDEKTPAADATSAKADGAAGAEGDVPVNRAAAAAEKKEKNDRT